MALSIETTIEGAAVVWAVGLALRQREALARAGLAVHALDPADAPIGPAPSGARLVAAAARHVGDVRRALEATPLLAFVDAPEEAVAAAADGADAVLAADAPDDMVRAACVAAERVGRDRARLRALEAALELVSESVEITDPAATLQYVNRAFERMTGRARGEAIGKTPAELLRSHLHDAGFYRGMFEALTNKRTWSGSLVARRKDGALVPQIATIAPVCDDAGIVRHHVAVKQFLPDEPAGEIASGEELAEHVRASIASVTNSERRFRAIMENAADAILVVDAETEIVIEANPAACALYGYELHELRGMKGQALAHPVAREQPDRIRRGLDETGRALEDRFPVRRKDGSLVWTTVHVATYELMGRLQRLSIVRDASERVAHERELERTNRRLEEMQKQLLHSSRLAALGQMAAGVAHEINNPLQYILTSLDDIDAALATAPAETRLALADMREGVERVRLVTRSLLPFVNVDGAPERVDLRDVVEWACRVTSNEIRHRARLDLALASVPPILAHRVRIGQLVTNLLTNAAHAIEEGRSEQNRITVTTSFAGDRVRLTVEDTGMGIPDAVRARIFDPFFSTKPRDVGTGLGLPLCAEIVARNGGTIGFESEVGRGTSFVVTFEPVSPAAPKPGRCARVTPSPEAIRVLVVDDEERLLETFSRFLRGMEITTARGGAAAVERVASDAAIDVVVCDLMMPDVDGPMVYARVKELRPGLEQRIVFCTGGAFTDRARAFLASIPNVVLDKPVTSQRLRDAVRDAGSV